MENLKEKYRLSLYEDIGEISKGKIYLVKSSLDDKIYIKKLLPKENQKIYDEIKELGLKNVPRVYEIIEEDDMVVIIEEYINGYSLKEILDKYESLPEAKVIDYMIQLINILSELNSGSSLIIHRDIKPSNIMINNDEILKLIDFDISRIHKTDKSTDTHILGTYGYAAPEQFGFNQSDIRTDIYSIGATMNILLTGKLPLEEAYEGNLSRIISKCLELDPRKRYQDLEGLRIDLEKAEKRHKVETKEIKNCGLPGFRSNRLILKIISFLWYGLIAGIIMGLFEEEGLTKERISSIYFGLFILSLTLLYGNYKDLRSRLPLTKSKNFFISGMGYLLYSFILFILFGSLLGS